jgi:plasmid maintenance system antidote protein VapI
VAEPTLKFDPDWVVAPGETLKDWFEGQGMPLSVAGEHGISQGQLARLFAGDEPITVRLAHRLANMTGISAVMWTALEHNFRVGLAVGKTWSRG